MMPEIQEVITGLEFIREHEVVFENSSDVINAAITYLRTMQDVNSSHVEKWLNYCNSHPNSDACESCDFGGRSTLVCENLIQRTVELLCAQRIKIQKIKELEAFKATVTSAITDAILYGTEKGGQAE